SAESAVRRRPSNLLRFAPAKEVENLRCALAILLLRSGTAGRYDECARPRGIQPYGFHGKRNQQ
ncbi:MAG: hypothetical protein ABI899_09375, partial [Actinomycetota bacterium]